MGGRAVPGDRVRNLIAVVFIVCVPLLAGPAQPAEHTPEVVAFGDSLTAGLGLPPEQAFPARLESRLHGDGIKVHIVNAGVSGDTTAGGVARLDWQLADKPDIVMLELGANDALRGIDPDIVRTNLETMIKKIQSSGAKVLLLGMQAPANWGEDYQRRFDRIYPELAHAYGAPLYPFFLEGVAMNSELNQPDGIHPNARGVAVIVKGVAPLLRDALGPLAGERS